MPDEHRIKIEVYSDRPLSAAALRQIAAAELEAIEAPQGAFNALMDLEIPEDDDA